MNTERIASLCIQSGFKFGGFYPELSSGKNIVELNDLTVIMDTIHEEIYVEDEDFPSDFDDLSDYPQYS